MAGFAEMFGMGADPSYLEGSGGREVGDPGGFMSFGMGGDDAIYQPGDPASQEILNAEEGNPSQTLGAVLGATQALMGLAGAFQAERSRKVGVKLGQSALRIKRTETRINKMLTKANFDNKMTSLLERHRSLEERANQEHQNRDSAYQKSMGTLRVMQAESGQEGTSAAEATAALTRSNLAAEQIMIANMKGAERSKAYEQEGLNTAKDTADMNAEFKEMGFNMQDINLRAQMATPSWAQVGMQMPQYMIGGWDTYYKFVYNTGRSGDLT